MIDIVLLNVMVTGIIGIIGAIGKIIYDTKQNKSSLNNYAELLNDVADITKKIHIHIVDNGIRVSPCNSNQDNQEIQNINDIANDMTIGHTPPSSPKDIKTTL